MARKAKGEGNLLYREPGGWFARYWVVKDGVPLRVTRKLDTHSRPVAQRKLARLIDKQTADPAEAKRIETFEEAARRVVAEQKADGLGTARERLSRLERFVFPTLGPVPVDRVDPEQIEAVAIAMHDAGKAKQTIVHVRNDIGGIMGTLWRNGVIPANPVQRVRLPKRLRQDRRPRVVLDEHEFSRLMASPEVPEHLQLMALTSRAFGGMRTSDLHAWDWGHVDTETFASAEVYRPKTDGDEPAELVRLEMPEVLRAPLRAWWTRWLRPSAGPVFPVMNGKRAGERQGKRSHVRELRAAVWAAGVHRPLPGFPEAMQALGRAEAAVEPAKAEGRAAWWAAARARREAEAAAQALDAVQTDTPKTRAVDFHSFRRGFNTALAAAGVNVQQAMALAGHRDPRTHMRYVELAQSGPLSMPDAAVPQLLGSLGSFAALLSAVTIGDPSENRTRVTGVRGAPTGAEIPTGDPNPAGRNVTGLCADDGPTVRAAAPGRGQVEPLQADERKAVLAALAAARAALDAGDVPRARAAIVALERRLEAAGEGEGAATA